MSDFAATLATAAHAETTAALLRRAAKYAAGRWNDARLLTELAEKYADYAATLREVIPAELEPEQPALI